MGVDQSPEKATPLTMDHFPTFWATSNLCGGFQTNGHPMDQGSFDQPPNYQGPFDQPPNYQGPCDQTPNAKPSIQ